MYHLYLTSKVFDSTEMLTSVWRWSHDTGQRIPCFDRCQLTITWMSNIKQGGYKSRLYVSVNHLAGVWPPSRAIRTRTRQRAIPLAMITMRKSIYGFPFLSYMSMGLRYIPKRDASWDTI